MVGCWCTSVWLEEHGGFLVYISLARRTWWAVGVLQFGQKNMVGCWCTSVWLEEHGGLLVYISLARRTWWAVGVHQFG